MKKIGIAIFVAALVVGLIVTNMFSFGGATTGKFFNFSMNFGGVHGSGNVATDKRSVSGFKAVDVGGIFQVEITAQKDFAVEVEADDNLLPLITTEVHDGVLSIETAERFKSSNPIRVRVYAPNIDSLEVSGVANVAVNDIKNSSLTIGSSGASKIKIAGETAKLTVETSGASKIDAEGLKAIDASIDSSGASHVNVNITGELTTDLSGASKVTYTGTPTRVEKNTSGASSVSQK